ncbi:hypothetical protein AB205_0026150 [Aquarana catesbeiana]|uniref:Secreted protein n=1 Tax=Aquarana catesbeiana TaxID=8400 RepID=A0A2G9RDV7_AQUCT|nr:hypothetical protein AB205_0026150 [Aquarana catesbeiana]
MSTFILIYSYIPLWRACLTRLMGDTLVHIVLSFPCHACPACGLGPLCCDLRPFSSRGRCSPPTLAWVQTLQPTVLSTPDVHISP